MNLFIFICDIIIDFIFLNNYIITLQLLNNKAYVSRNIYGEIYYYK